MESQQQRLINFITMILIALSLVNGFKTRDCLHPTLTRRSPASFCSPQILLREVLSNSLSTSRTFFSPLWKSPCKPPLYYYYGYSQQLRTTWVSSEELPNMPCVWRVMNWSRKRRCQVSHVTLRRDGSPGKPYFTPFSVFTLVFIPVTVAVSPMALDDQAEIRRSIQPECAKPRAPVLPCAAGLMEMNILGHSSAQNSEQSWRQSSGSSRDHGQDSTEMGRTRLSEGLMALGVRRSTFLAEEKHMQPDGGGSGGGVGSATFRQQQGEPPQGRGGHAGRAWEGAAQRSLSRELYPQPPSLRRVSLRRVFSSLRCEIWLKCRSPCCLFRELLGLSSSCKII